MEELWKHIAPPLFLQKLQWANHLHYWILGTLEPLRGFVRVPGLDLMGEKQSQCFPHWLSEDGWTSERSQEREPEPQLRAVRAAGNGSHLCRDTPNYTSTPLELVPAIFEDVQSMPVP